MTTFLADHEYENKEKYETDDYLFFVGYLAIIAFSFIAIVATWVVK